MRSGRKFSTNPISAMPGRLMSLTVISHAGRERLGQQLELQVLALVLVEAGDTEGLHVRLSPRRRASSSPAAGGLGHGAGDAGLALLCVDAPLLVAAELLLEAVGGELDRGAGLAVRLGADQLGCRSGAS